MLKGSWVKLITKAPGFLITQLDFHQSNIFPRTFLIPPSNSTLHSMSGGGGGGITV